MNSQEVLQRSLELCPEGTQTTSKAHSRFTSGAPTFIHHAEGPYIWDLEGNRWIDTIGSLGANLLGYRNEAINEAVLKVLNWGCISGSIPHVLEVEAAQTLLKAMDRQQIVDEQTKVVLREGWMVRFARSGHEATQMGVRLAKAHTGDYGVAYCGYHGCDDWYATNQPKSGGVSPDLRGFVAEFKFNDLASLEKLLITGWTGEGMFETSQIRTVIIEHPVDEPAKGFYQGIRDLCDKYGAVFVLDEVVTGIRFGLTGAAGMYGIKPDIICLGKGLANGHALSACVARPEIMNRLAGDVFYSTTFGGEVVGLAAMIATIHELQTRPIHRQIEELGAKFINFVKGRIKLHNLGKIVELAGNPYRMTLRINHPEADLLRSIWMEQGLRHGVLWGVPIYIHGGFRHEHVDVMMKAASDGLRVMRQALDSEEPGKFLKSELAHVVTIGNRR